MLPWKQTQTPRITVITSILEAEFFIKPKKQNPKSTELDQISL